MLLDLLIPVQIIMTYSALLVFIISLFQRSKQLRFIVVLMFTSFIFDFAFDIAYYGFDYVLPNYGTIYRLLEFIILIEFYYLLLIKKRTKKSLLIKTIAQITPSVLLIMLFGLESSPIRITNSLIFTLCSVIFFTRIIREMVITEPLKHPLFWINAAILVYFSGVLFVFLIFEPLARINSEIGGASYLLHNFFGILKNILIGIGFYMAIKNPNWSTNLLIENK